MAQVPNFSVVVPTEGRIALFALLLSSLRIAASLYSGLTEVIIVDSSDKDTANHIDTLCRKQDAIYLRGPRSVRAKRNLGISHAQYEIVLFIDSDCTAVPDLFIEHAACYQPGKQEPVGCVGLVHFQPSASFWSSVVKRTSYGAAFRLAQESKSPLWGPTANISYRASVLREVGCFEERLPFRLGGDDVDIGLRITSAGHSLAQNPKAIVIHSAETWGKVAVLRRALRWGRVQFHLFRRHPTHRRLSLASVPAIFLLLGLPSTGISLLLKSWPPLLVPGTWFALYLIAMWILLATTGRRARSVCRDWCAALLELPFEIGYLIEGLTQGDFRVLYMSLSYVREDEGEPDRISFGERKAIRYWAILIALILSIPASAYLYSRGI